MHGCCSVIWATLLLSLYLIRSLACWDYVCVGDYWTGTADMTLDVLSACGFHGFPLEYTDLLQPEIPWPVFPHTWPAFASWQTFPNWLKSAFRWRPPRITDPCSSNRTGRDSVRAEPSNYWRERNTRSTWSSNREQLRRREYVCFSLCELIAYWFYCLHNASFASTLRQNSRFIKCRCDVKLQMTNMHHCTLSDG